MCTRASSDDVLNGIARNIRQITRMMTQDTNRNACLVKLATCVTHLNDIRESISAEHFTAIEESLRALRAEITNMSSETPAERFYTAPRPLSGSLLLYFCMFVNKCISGNSVVGTAGCWHEILYRTLKLGV